MNDKVGDEQAKAKIDAGLAWPWRGFRRAGQGVLPGYRSRPPPAAFLPATLVAACMTLRFEEALYALKQRYPPRCRLRYGYHLIKLLGVGANSTRPGKPAGSSRTN